MEDNVGSSYIINGVQKLFEAADKVSMPEKGVVYEVIRIIDRVPLFFEDHYERMVNSLNMLGCRLETGMKEMGRQIAELIRANGLVNCNVKVVVYSVGSSQNSIMYISKSYYPSGEEFEKGVPVSLMQWERNNPNAKVVNRTYKEEVARRLSGGKVFEVLLVNGNGFITEGSRSNTFFIKGSRVFTAPGELVLKGITRKYIIQVCKDLGYEVVEALTSVDSLKEIDGLFISGTSIKVLPVSAIDETSFSSSTNPVIKAVGKSFDRLIQDYIDEHR